MSLCIMIWKYIIVNSGNIMISSIVYSSIRCSKFSTE